MGFISEFKEFASKGNVVDLAVGVIIGGAFGKIVNSMVNDILMPPLGMILGGINFKEFSIVLKDKVGDTPAVVLGYGAFIQNVFDFLILAFCIFLMIKSINTLKRKQVEVPAAPPAPPEPSSEEKLLMEIRDLLKK
ncbi:MAG: large-conductance mechanosensitive channel protein MscL [Candidatus Kapaibacterium sp.]|jgi:large conductance mechanosensitive channel|nr:large-conductance mechanosensitive channel protein MscL [Candidatus Kapabacteria bacterium]